MILAANWKMHIPPAEARDFARRFLALVAPRPERSLTFFPPAVSLETTAAAFADRPDVMVGIQDVHWEPKGAFTGATSVALAAGAGARCGLVGHSERRHVFGETDDATERKVNALLAGSLVPYLCVGETLEQREGGLTERVVLRQLDAGVGGLTADQLSRLVIAYEPVWAIGTGRTATPGDAAAVHRIVRERLVALGAATVPILYGGSVNQSNIGGLVSRPEIDGVLVGGASLHPEGWAELVRLADSTPR